MNPIIFTLGDQETGIFDSGVGPIEVRWYGLMYVVAIIVGIFLVNREIKRRGLSITLDDILDFVLITIPIAIVFARLYYVVFSWNHYGQNLSDIYKIWEGGLAIHGGLIGGAIALVIFTKWKKISFWKFADVIAPSLILGMALGRFGNFMNGDAYGTPTDSIFGIVFPRESPAGSIFPEEHIHPTMLYEMTGDLLIFGLLMFLRLRPYRDGFLISVYAMLYAALRFVVEIFRGDALCVTTGNVCVQGATTFFETLRVAQVISVVIFIVFAVILIRKQLYLQDNPDSKVPPPPPVAPKPPPDEESKEAAASS